MTKKNHPFESFKFCPKCGSKAFEVRDEKSKRCQDCHFTYYANVATACTCFVTDLWGNLLVAVRGREPAKGTYDLPGGFADLHETVEEAMARELLEETGIDVHAGIRGGVRSPLQYMFSLPNEYLYSDFVVHTMDMVFTLELESLYPYEGRGEDDVAELKVIPFREVHPEDFGLKSIAKAVELVQSKRGYQRRR